MSSSLISAWKKNFFSNPFQAACENGEGAQEGLAVNEERTIAAAASGESQTPDTNVQAPESQSADKPQTPVSDSPAAGAPAAGAPAAGEPAAGAPADGAPAAPGPEGAEVKAPEAAAASEPEPEEPAVSDLIKEKVQMVSLVTIPCASSVTNRRYEEYSCEFGSGKYYGLCAFGGLLSCGLTHTAVVPLDLVKCRIQVDAAKYGNIVNGFRVTLAEEGFRALGKGWAPTFIGYSMQGVGKFGFYEAFKILYSGMLGEENTYLWRTSLYLAASASAEFFADIALCPMEAVKVRIQTQPGWSNTLREGFPRIMQEEGIAGFYKGLVPLWARQIPYTMMKFACFERTVEALYKYVVPKPRSDCSKSEQLVVTFAAGYIAGVFCAIVSHPADTIVSKLNQDKGSNFVQIAQRLGFMGMWKGLFPRIIMIGTLTALQWFIYDSVKVAFRLPRPPPPEMPESLKKKMGLA